MGKSSLCLLTLLAVLAAAIADEKYPSDFDYINADDILADDGKRVEYYNCLMDLGPCTNAEQQFLKKYAVEAFVTKCQKCTDAQKTMIEKITEWYITNRPDEWNILVVKFLEEAKKNNITPVL